MPMNSKYKYAYRKKRRRRRKKNGVSTIVIPYPAITPDQVFVKLKYNTAINLVSGTGTFISHTFRGNGLFDPDQSGAGGQPRGYDQWSAMYTRYTGLACKITVRVIPHVNQGGPCILGVVPTDTSSPFTDIESIIESPYSKTAMLNNKTVSPQTMTASLTTKRKFGYHTGILQEDDLSANVTALPAEQWYWFLGFENIPQPTNLDVTVDVQLEYSVRFFDRKDLGNS